MILFFYFLAGYLGGIACLLEAFEIPAAGVAFYGGLGLFALLYGFLYRTGKIARFTIPAVTVTYAVAAVCWFPKIAKGWNLILMAINRVVLKYTGVSDTAQDLTGENLQAVWVCLLFVCFLLGGLLFYGVFVKSAKTLGVLYSCCVIGIVLAVGKTPGTVQTALLVFFCMGTLAGAGVRQTGVRRKTLLLTGLAGAVCLLLGHFLAAPLLEPAFSGREEARARLQSTHLVQDLLKKLPDITGGFLAKGGLGEGDLTGNDGFLFSGKTALKVHTREKPEGAIYLRGYVGTRYTSESWEAVPDESWAAWDQMIYGYLSYMETYYFGGNPSSMEVTLEDANEKYSYSPYFSQPISSAVEGLKRYHWIPVEHVEELRDLGYSYLIDGNAGYSDREREAQISYPAKGLERLQALVDENPLSSPGEITEFIVNTLRTRAKYNLQTGRFPRGEDFAEYFLFEAGEGYCIHFATTAALLFRMYGIPSRYVEGYIAPAADFKKDTDGYTAEVTDERAHAWTEVFLPDFGWMPVEATPGYGAGSEDTEEESSQQPQTRPESEKQKTGQETETEKKQETEKEETRSSLAGKILPGLAGGVLLCLLICLLLTGRRRLVLKKREGLDAAGLFVLLYRNLLAGGWKEEADCGSPEFAGELAKIFPWMETDRMEDVMEIVMRANFGKEPVTEEERQRVQRMYRLVSEKVYEGLPPWRKLWSRYGRIL